MAIEIGTTASGVRFVIDSYDSPVAAVAITVEAGTRHEEPKHNGVAHFLEHMAFKGTIRRTAQQIDEAIEDRGGSLNAYTGKDTTQYAASVLSEDAPLALDVLADIVSNSTFPEAEVDLERGVILQENRDFEENTEGWFGDRLMEVAFTGGLALPGLGTPETLQSVGRREILAFVRDHYLPQKIIVAAAGGVDPEEFHRLAEGYFSRSRAVPAKPEQPSHYKGGVFRHSVERPNVTVLIAFPSLPLGHTDLYSDVLFCRVIGGCNSSPLWQELREKRGLCYEVGLSGQAWLQSGLNFFKMSCGEDDAHEAIAVLCEQIKRSRDGLTADQISFGQRLCRATVLMGQETTWERLSAADRHLAIHGKAYDAAEEVAKYEAVGADDIARTVERMWSAPPTIAIRGSERACEIDIAAMLR